MEETQKKTDLQEQRSQERMRNKQAAQLATKKKRSKSCISKVDVTNATVFSGRLTKPRDKSNEDQTKTSLIQDGLLVERGMHKRRSNRERSTVVEITAL